MNDQDRPLVTIPNTYTNCSPAYRYRDLRDNPWPTWYQADAYGAPYGGCTQLPGIYNGPLTNASPFGPGFPSSTGGALPFGYGNNPGAPTHFFVPDTVNVCGVPSVINPQEVSNIYSTAWRQAVPLSELTVVGQDSPIALAGKSWQGPPVWREQPY